MSAKYHHFYDLSNLPNDLVSEGVDKDCLLCPFCESHGEPSRKPTLYIYKDSMTGYCFRCKSFIYTSKTEYEHSLTNEIDKEFNNNLKCITSTNEVEYDSIHLDGLDPYESDEELVDYIKTQRSPSYHQLLVDLNCRSFSKKINQYYTNKGILFPFYIDGKVVSYQIRFINVEKRFRYYTKPGTKIPFRIEDNFNQDSITICEGVFDCLGYKCLGFPNPVAILASTINDSVGKILKNYSQVKNVFIGLDDLKLCYDLLPLVNGIFPLAQKFIIKLPDGLDPDETFIKESKTGTNRVQLINCREKLDWQFDNALKKICR